MSILSSSCKYGIRATVYLALNNGDSRNIGIKKIASDLDIPTPFLGKILQNLVRNKILSSTKGPNGGFSLALPPDKIALYDIIKIIDGDDLFNECLIGLRSCEEEGDYSAPCPTNRKFKPISNQMLSFFKNETIESLKKEVMESGGTVAI